MAHKFVKKHHRIGLALILIIQPLFLLLFSIGTLFYTEDAHYRLLKPETGQEWAYHENMMDYLKGSISQETVQLSVPLTPAEAAHLQDVRNRIVWLQIAIIVGLIVLLALLWFVPHSSHASMWASFIGLGISALILILPFQLVFTAFHSLFFKAHTWMFPPDSVFMFVYGRGFWQAIVGWILAVNALLNLIVALIAWWSCRHAETVPVRKLHRHEKDSSHEVEHHNNRSRRRKKFQFHKRKRQYRVKKRAKARRVKRR